jgi:hypothetical protein
MGRRIASQSKQTVRGGPKPAKVGLHRRLIQARLQCNFGDVRKRNEDILKTGRGLTIKLSKKMFSVSCIFI